MNSKIRIKISEDFSDTPGGRYRREGPYSGEAFREDILEPKYLTAQKEGKRLEVDMDGCFGYPSSFLDESFGQLARQLENKDLLSNIDLISQDQPGIIEFIQKCVQKD